MPTIKLKPQSPEFDENASKPEILICDMPGCDDEAEHKAPKHRNLNEYYHFCLDHVREYNKAWNFFDGMSDQEVKEHIYKDMYGDRPTWKYRDFQNLEETLYRKSETFREGYARAEKDAETHYIPEHLKGTPEMEALAYLGLVPPITFDEVKKQYKILVKKYHPDHNPDDKDADEKIKKINMSYTLLKVAFTNYEQIENLKNQN